MRYIDTERQLANIFTKPLDTSHFADLQGKLMFVIHIAWFEGELMIYLIYCIFYLSLALSSYSPKSLCFGTTRSESH
jgi:hypothetical protein